jgi:hypothetical protein
MGIAAKKIEIGSQVVQLAPELVDEYARCSTIGAR